MLTIMSRGLSFWRLGTGFGLVTVLNLVGVFLTIAAVQQGVDLSIAAAMPS